MGIFWGERVATGFGVLGPWGCGVLGFWGLEVLGSDLNWFSLEDSGSRV